jgi:hypothetical protein
MLSFEMLKELWEDKEIPFSEFDSVSNDSLVFKRGEPRHYYMFEAKGIVEDGSGMMKSIWQCIDTSDRSRRNIKLCNWFEFITIDLE